MALEDIAFPTVGLDYPFQIFNDLVPADADNLVAQTGTATFRLASDHTKTLITALNEGSIVYDAVLREYVNSIDDTDPSLDEANLFSLIRTLCNFGSYYLGVVYSMRASWTSPEATQTLWDNILSLYNEIEVLENSLETSSCPLDAGYLAQIATLTSDLATANNATATAQAALVVANNTITLLTDDIDTANGTITSLTNALSAEQAAHAQTVADKNNEINTINTANAVALAGKQAEIDALNAQILALQGDTSALDAMRAERDAAIANYNTEHAEVIRITNLYNALYASSGTVNQQLAQALEREALANDTIAARDIMITTLNKEIYRLNEELNKAQLKIDELEARPTNETVLAQLQEDIRILQDQLEVTSLEATNLQAEVNITNAKLEACGNRNAALQRRIQELEEIINESSSAVTLEQVKNDLTRAEEDIYELEEEIRQLDDTNNRLLMRIDELVKTIRDHAIAAEERSCTCGWTTIGS